MSAQEATYLCTWSNVMMRLLLSIGSFLTRGHTGSAQVWCCSYSARKVEQSTEMIFVSSCLHFLKSYLKYWSRRTTSLLGVLYIVYYILAFGVQTCNMHDQRTGLSTKLVLSPLDINVFCKIFRAVIFNVDYFLD